MSGYQYRHLCITGGICATAPTTVAHSVQRLTTIDNNLPLTARQVRIICRPLKWMTPKSYFTCTHDMQEALLKV